MLLLKVINREDSTVSKPDFICVLYLYCDWHTDKSLMLCLPSPLRTGGRHNMHTLHQRLIMPNSRQCVTHVSWFTFLLLVQGFLHLFTPSFSSIFHLLLGALGLCHGFPPASLCPSTLSPRTQWVGDNIMMCVRLLHSEYTSGGERCMGEISIRTRRYGKCSSVIWHTREHTYSMCKLR